MAVCASVFKPICLPRPDNAVSAASVKNSVRYNIKNVLLVQRGTNLNYCTCTKSHFEGVGYLNYSRMPLGTAKHLIWKTEEKFVKFKDDICMPFSLIFFL